MAAGHQCFGCQRQILDYEEHIHIGLDEWSAHEGLEGSFGLDHLLTFALCSECIQRSDRGWQPEAHEIEGAA